MEKDAERIEHSSTTGGLPVAPSMGPLLENEAVADRPPVVDGRVVAISALAVVIAVAAGFVAQILTHLIGFVTNLAYYGRFSWSFTSPAENHLGWWAVLVPIGGGLIVGVLARYGSAAIRGHGIPEAMEQILTNKSRIPARVTFLKPLSAAIAIGTGGPFGAEGPIIATGGALGSLLGQFLETSAIERKTLLAAGAAAGMAATFGSPVSAVLLAIELLLFEYRPRSLIPVSLAAVTATMVRIAFSGAAPVFAMPALAQPSGEALGLYVALGTLIGVAAIAVTRAVYEVEDAFDRLPIHWMWWPALGGLAVGVFGLFAPRTLGVGYDNIDAVLSNGIVGAALVMLVGFKFLSWAIALGSGTSGGTLAPLFTIGGGLGAMVCALLIRLAPGAGLDPRMAALVGMAAMFTGASRAMLASVVFAFETTHQTSGLLPLLGGCSAAFLVSCLFMRNTIMTEKIERRGVRVLGEYAADPWARLSVGAYASKPVITLRGADLVEAARAFIDSGAESSSHQGFPVLGDGDCLLGVLTRRDLEHGRPGAHLSELIQRPPVVITSDASLRDAADAMARERVGRLPVIERDAPGRVVGILTRSDLIAAHSLQLEEDAREPGRWAKRGVSLG